MKFHKSRSFKEIDFNQIENMSIKSLEYVYGHPVSRVVNLNFINVVA